MKRQTRRFGSGSAVSLLMLLVLAGCTKHSETDLANNSAPARRVTSETVVRVEAPPVELNAGASTEATVRLRVDDGYHVNANPASFPYLIATQLNVPAADGISAAKVSYPAPLNKKFAFAEAPLAVYEGEARAQGRVAGGQRRETRTNIHSFKTSHPSLRRSGVLSAGHNRCLDSGDG